MKKGDTVFSFIWHQVYSRMQASVSFKLSWVELTGVVVSYKYNLFERGRFGLCRHREESEREGCSESDPHMHFPIVFLLRERLSFSLLIPIPFCFTTLVIEFCHLSFLHFWPFDSDFNSNLLSLYFCETLYKSHINEEDIEYKCVPYIV